MARVAPSARILSDPEGQRALLPRSLAATERLHSCWPTHTATADLSWLRSALMRAPAHRDRLRTAGLTPHDLQDVCDLVHFPLLDRPTLAAHWDGLTLTGDDLVVVRSSGSSGQPVKVPKDRYDCLHMWSVIRFWCEVLQIPLVHPRVCLLDALPGGLEYSAEVPLFAEGRMTRISTMLPDATARLAAFDPLILSTDPAGLHWWAAHPVSHPALILSGAQHLSDVLRARIAEITDAPLIDYYALTETGPVAWRCLHTSAMHILAPDVYVESVDGEIVVTRLRPAPLVMLRYQTGDRGMVRSGTCVCGFSGTSIHDLHGRARCDFVRPDGSLVDAWQLAWVFKQVPLDAFVLAQIGPARFRLQHDGSDAVLPLLRGALQNLGFPDPTIEVGQVPALPGEKARPFRCQL